jgi:hypothetical protein
MTSPIDGLPTPRRDRLTLYVLGPGFGESIVVALPDGLCMVVDSAVAPGGEHLTLALLDALGLRDIHLLVLTHPDADHIAGADRLFDRARVHALWRYPAGSLVRDLIATFHRSRPDDSRMEALQKLHDAIERHVRSGLEVTQMGAHDTAWIPPSEAYEVRSIAPTTYDRMRMEDQFQYLLQTDGAGDPALSERLRDTLAGGRRWGDHPNTVSGAVTVWWGGVGVLLAGDVENGTKHRQSGWAGVLDRLRGNGTTQPDRTHRVRDLAMVKVAHHGSEGAYHDDAWALHAASRPVPVSVITPFDRQANPPPHDLPLGALRGRTTTLSITAPGGGAIDRTLAAGWSPSVTSVAATLPVVAVDFDKFGAYEVFVGGESVAMR